MKIPVDIRPLDKPYARVIYRKNGNVNLPSTLKGMTLGQNIAIHRISKSKVSGAAKNAGIGIKMREYPKLKGRPNIIEVTCRRAPKDSR